MKWWLVYYRRFSFINNRKVMYIQAYYTNDIYREIGKLAVKGGELEICGFEEVKDYALRRKHLSESYENICDRLWKMK